MAPHRWSSRNAVRKEDQFTAAPDFIDEHDSDHLPMWGRLEATWSGMGPQRRVLVASSVVVVAGAIAAVAFVGLANLAGGGTDPGAQQGLAAEDDRLEDPSGLVSQAPHVPDPGIQPVDDLLNATASPSPPAPPLVP